MRPRSINIFLADGDPSGIRVAQVSMSTIQALAFRKLQLSQVRERFQELSRPGVYLLLGYDETDFEKLIAYVGQSECVADRLRFHAGKEDKNYWTDTIALVSKDENLTASHARYVEARLISDASLNPRWTLDNTQRASELGKLPLPDREAMEEFIDQTKTLVGSLGCDLFKVVTGSSVVTRAEKTSIEGSPVFYYSGKGYEAEMAITDGREFVLKKGSRLRLVTAATAPEGIVALRAKLIEKGLLSEIGGHLVLNSDYVFRSVSSAAAIVSGTSVNGRNAWKMLNKLSFADWEGAQEG